MSIVRNVSNVNLVDVLLHFLRFNWESRKGLKEEATYQEVVTS